MESNRKITVCHIISGDLWAGAEAQAFTMISGLQKLPDFRLSAIVLNPGKLANKLATTGVAVTVIREADHSFSQIVSKASEILAVGDIHIVHSHRYKENLIAAILKRRGRVPALVQTVHGVHEKLSGWRNFKVGIYGKVNTFVSRRYFDSVIAVSKDICLQLTPRFGQGKVRHVPNAIDLDAIKTIKPPTAIRRELGIAEDDPVIGTVGRMVPIKGFDVFLRTVQQILKSHPRTQFVLVGDGPESPKLMALSGELGISGNVHFTGFRDDVFEVVNAFDIFMMTSWHEGIPVALLESMALRKPTVATAVGGVGEVIDNKNSGLLVNAGDVNALASSCECLLDSVDRRRQMGDLARVRVEQEFSTIIQRERLRNIYRGLVS